LADARDAGGGWSARRWRYLAIADVFVITRWRRQKRAAMPAGADFANLERSATNLSLRVHSRACGYVFA